MRRIEARITRRASCSSAARCYLERQRHTVVTSRKTPIQVTLSDNAAQSGVVPVGCRRKRFLPGELLRKRFRVRQIALALVGDLLIVPKDFVIDIRVEILSDAFDRRLRVLVDRPAGLDHPFRLDELHHLQVARALADRLFAVRTVAFVLGRVLHLQAPNADPVLLHVLVPAVLVVLEDVRHVIGRRAQQRARDRRTLAALQIDVPQLRQFGAFVAVEQLAANLDLLIACDVLFVRSER